MFTGTLKETALAGLKPKLNDKGKLIEVEYSDGGNLYLVATTAGTHRWMFKFTCPVTRKPNRRMGLGLLDHVPLQEARRLAFENRKLLHAGKNPMEARDAALAIAAQPAGGPTFKEFAAQVRSKAISGMSEKSVQRWDRGMTVYAAPLHDKKIAAITRHDVAACLDKIWAEIPVAAKKFQTQLWDLFDRATVVLTNEIYPEDKRNPADFRLLAKMLDKQVHVETSHRSLPYQEMPIAWQRMVEVDTMASWTAQFIVLTLVRTGEAVLATKDQFDLDHVDGPIWNIPGKVMKNGKPANVPLSREAAALVRKVLAWQQELGIETDYLFPGSDRTFRIDGSRAQSENTVLFFLQKQLKLDTTTHGIRGTFRSWGGDQDGIEREVLEHCLHHLVGDTAELAYNKADQRQKRQAVLQAWADYATGKHAPNGARRRPDLKVVAA
jgi:integrase